MILLATLQSFVQAVEAACKKTPPQSSATVGTVLSLLIAGADAADMGHSKSPASDASALTGAEAELFVAASGLGRLVLP